MGSDRGDVFMQLFIGDYLADTMHLSTTENGGYIRLLMHYYRTGSIPNTDEMIARITQIDADAWAMLKHPTHTTYRAAFLQTMRSFFVEKNGMLINKRAEKERAKLLKQREVSSNRGRAGAEKRWEGRRKTDAPSNAQAILKQCSSNAQAIACHNHSTCTRKPNYVSLPSNGTCAREEKKPATKKPHKIQEVLFEHLDDVTTESPIWPGCKFFRMSKSEFTESANWYKKNNLPSEMLTAAIEEIDLWLTDAPTQAAKKARKQPNHHNRLRAGWVLDNVRKRFPGQFRPVNAGPNNKQAVDKPKTITEKNQAFFKKMELEQQQKQQTTQEPNNDESATDNAVIEVSFKHLANAGSD